MTTTTRRRRFWVLMAWNTVFGLAIALPLAWLLQAPLGRATAWFVTASFAGLMLIMGAILAAYFAFLRT